MTTERLVKKLFLFIHFIHSYGRQGDTFIIFIMGGGNKKGKKAKGNKTRSKVASSASAGLETGHRSTAGLFISGLIFGLGCTWFFHSGGELGVASQPANHEYVKYSGGVEELHRAMTERPGVPFAIHNLSWPEFESIFNDVSKSVVRVRNESMLSIKYRRLEPCTEELCGRREDVREGWYGPGEYDGASRVPPPCDEDFCTVGVYRDFVRETKRAKRILWTDFIERIPIVSKFMPAMEKTMGRSFVSRLVIQMFFSFGKYNEAKLPPAGESLSSVVGTGSFGWHGDWDFDVIIILTKGLKRFRVAGYRKKRTPVVIDEIMRPGTAVYIPRGYFHNGMGLGESTLVSMAIKPEREGLVRTSTSSAGTGNFAEYDEL